MENSLQEIIRLLGDIQELLKIQLTIAILGTIQIQLTKEEKEQLVELGSLLMFGKK